MILTKCLTLPGKMIDKMIVEENWWWKKRKKKNKFYKVLILITIRLKTKMITI